MYVLFQFRMQSLERLKLLFVNDLKPTWEYEVKMVDILVINIHLLCKF